jgi:hypothetical protein
MIAKTSVIGIFWNIFGVFYFLGFCLFTEGIFVCYDIFVVIVCMCLMFAYSI